MKAFPTWTRFSLCVLCVLWGEAFVSALDREAFTFSKYDLDVRIEPDQQRLGVRGKLTLRNDSTTPQTDLALQISSSLDWRSIRIAGKPVQFVTHEYTSDIDHTGALSEAVVSLPHEVPPKGTLEIEIGYEGTIPLDVTRLTRIGVPEEKARHTDWDQVGKSFTAVRGIGYVVWYPVAMEAASLSDGNSVAETVGRWKSREAQSELNAKLTNSGVGAPTMLFCNGEAGQQASHQVGRHSAGATECHYDPLRTTVPLFVIGGYQALDKPAVNISYLPEHKSGAENYALAADLAAPLVTEWFGAPRMKAEVVELADSEAAPFESGSMLLTPLGSNDSRLYMLRAAHQLTHAALLSPRPWIYEGLAHFAQALEREQQNGRQAALDFMEQHRAAIGDAEKAIAAEHSQNAAADESLINTGAEDFYRSKAMYVWWMLRDMLGDAALKKALAAYRADDDKEPAYMQHLIAAQSQRDLEWFFDDWVYRDRGLPDFRVESAYPRATVDGHYVVTITVENPGDAGAEIPVRLRFEGGEETKRLEVRAKSKAVIRLEASGTPLEVVVNDGSVPESDSTNNTYKIETPKP
jgi:hypothetical protein